MELQETGTLRSTPIRALALTWPSFGDAHDDVCAGTKCVSSSFVQRRRKATRNTFFGITAFAAIMRKKCEFLQIKPKLCTEWIGVQSFLCDASENTGVPKVA